MADQKISQLTTIVTVDNATDLFPIVDTSVGETKKITPTALKTALALNNVDNTTDALKPISTATQTALNAKQDTLVSATNIKTVNSTSLLGSGDIVVGATPSGVAGAIQFSNGTAFSSDAANLSFDDTNNRLGVGTNAPTAKLQVENSTNGSLVARFKDSLAATTYIDCKTDSTLTDRMGLYWGSDYRFLSKQGASLFINCEYNAVFANGLQAVTTITPSEVQVGSITGARLGIKGSGATSATASLLVQNSASTQTLKVNDDGSINIGQQSNNNFPYINLSGIYGGLFLNTGDSIVFRSAGTEAMRVNGALSVGIGASTINASAKLQVDTTTQGFLPPRMTTTQKNAIATPPAGLMVYDTTLNKLCVRTASTWETITSV